MSKAIHIPDEAEGPTTVGNPIEKSVCSNEGLSAESLKNQRDLLGSALGRILIAHGVVNPMPLTGPELLMAATDYADHLEKQGR